MKNYLLLFVLLLFGGFYTTAKTIQAFQIYSTNGKKIGYSKMIKEISSKKFLFFGEMHNNPIAHWLEFELTKELHTLHKNKLVMGAEMFEADNQFIIDEYLTGLISSKSFQSEVRLWPNYNTDYKPLLEYARDNQIPFIASNIPRRYANMVYKKGLTSLEALSDLARSYMVPLSDFEFDSTITCYKELIHSMKEHGGNGIATAQAIKDATMAYFILKNTSDKSIFLHFNGSYHSNNNEGIIYYLSKKVDLKTIATIATVSQRDIHKLENANKKVADFIICIPESMTKTH